MPKSVVAYDPFIVIGKINFTNIEISPVEGEQLAHNSFINNFEVRRLQAPDVGRKGVEAKEMIQFKILTDYGTYYQDFKPTDCKEK